MKTLWYVIALVVGTIGSLFVSNVIFDVIVNSDLSPFWKWIFLH